MLLVTLGALALSVDTCTVSGVTGTCMDTSRCGGTTTSGLCPGAANIKCCTYGSCVSNLLRGNCLETSACSGTTTSGLCPGPSGIKCCTNEHGSCTASGVDGKCAPESKCTETTTSGLCPGAANIKCCTTVPPTPAPTPVPTLVPASAPTPCSYNGASGECKDESMCTGQTRSGLCPGAANIKCCLPMTNTNLPSCATPINKFAGSCMDYKKCTGGSFRGVCKGSSSVQCCVPESPLSGTPSILSLEQFLQLFTSVGSVRGAALLPYFNSALGTVLAGSTGNKKCFRQAAFVAQVSHESAGLLYFEELASGAAYEGRKDLGNTQTGDGVRFKGRGPIQLTGRANYKSAGDRLSLDLTGKPDLVIMPSVGFKTTVDYWVSRSLNTHAETGTYASFVTLTKRINGGTNGLADRVSKWNKAKLLFGC